MKKLHVFFIDWAAYTIDRGLLILVKHFKTVRAPVSRYIVEHIVHHLTILISTKSFTCSHREVDIGDSTARVVGSTVAAAAEAAAAVLGFFDSRAGTWSRHSHPRTALCCSRGRTCHPRKTDVGTRDTRNSASGKRYPARASPSLEGGWFWSTMSRSHWNRITCEK